MNFTIIRQYPFFLKEKKKREKEKERKKLEKDINNRLISVFIGGFYLVSRLIDY